MKIKLSEFPHQPKSMPCCSECMGKKDCEPDPLNCADFYIHNKKFIDAKLAEKGES